MKMLRRMRSLGWIGVVVGCLLMQSALTFAAAPVVYDFRLLQAEVRLPAVKAYVEVTGVNDLPAKGLEPSLFKGKLADNSITVKKVTPFEDAGEGIAYVLLVDVSKSLTPSQFQMMRETLASFLDTMADKDQAALVTYGSQVKVLQDYTKNRGTLKTQLLQLSRSDDETAFYAALERGLTIARSAGADVPRYRAIVSLTDGVNDLGGGASLADIQKQLARDPIPLYLIGFLDGKPTPDEERALSDMKEFAKVSGGRYYDGRGRDWREIYFSVVRSIRNSFVVELDAPGIRSDGQPMTLEMSVAGSNKTWNEKLNVTVPAGGSAGNIDANKEKADKAAADAAKESDGQWIYIGAGILLLAGLAIGGWVWWRGRRRIDGAQTGTMPVMPASVAPAPVSAPATAPVSTPVPAVAAVAVNLPDTGTDSPVQDAGVVGLMVRLTRTHEGPPPNQLDFELSDRVVLGNDPTLSHMVFENDPVMGPAHCALAFEQGFVYVESMGAWDTLVNGATLNGRQRIEEQDILQMGQTEMRITFPF